MVRVLNAPARKDLKFIPYADGKANHVDGIAGPNLIQDPGRKPGEGGRTIEVSLDGLEK
jgi:hypothetical protein